MEFTDEFLQGYAVGKSGSDAACPYDVDSDRFKHWHRGYDEGQFIRKMKQRDREATQARLEKK